MSAPDFDVPAYSRLRVPEVCQKHRREYCLPNDCPECEKEAIWAFRMNEIHKRKRLAESLLDGAEPAAEDFPAELPPLLASRVDEFEQGLRARRRAAVAVVLIGAGLIVFVAFGLASLRSHIEAQRNRPVAQAVDRREAGR